jgi:3-hydroxybutyryl-CoA dehydrogenase
VVAFAFIVQARDQETRMVTTIAVLGAGTMGHGIAHAAMAAGYETRLYDVSETQLAKARAIVDGIVAKGVELGRVGAADGEAIRGRLSTTAAP